MNILLMRNYLKVPILNDEYKVIFCFGSPDKIRKVLDNWHYPKEDVAQHLNNRRGICFNRIGCHPVIAMPDFPDTPQEIGTLAHEACHAVEYILQNIQQPVGDELFAHSVGAIVRKVLASRDLLTGKRENHEK